MRSRIDRGSSDLLERTNRVGVQFLFADVEMGLTFMSVGMSSNSMSTRSRNIDRANEADTTVVRLLPRIILTPDERLKMDKKFRDPRSRLEGQGFSFIH